MLQEANFSVIEVPAVGIPEDGKEIDATGYKFIVREDTGTILSCMTDDYRLVKNETIMNYADPVIKKNKGVLKEVRLLAVEQKQQ